MVLHNILITNQQDQQGNQDCPYAKQIVQAFGKIDPDEADIETEQTTKRDKTDSQESQTDQLMFPSRIRRLLHGSCRFLAAAACRLSVRCLLFQGITSIIDSLFRKTHGAALCLEQDAFCIERLEFLFLHDDPAIAEYRVH